MKPLHYYAIAVTVIAIVLGVFMFRSGEDHSMEQLRLQMANDSLRRDMASRDGLIVALNEKDSLWRRRFIQLVAEDQPRVIYKLFHERFANTSGDSAVEFLRTEPTGLWTATYPGRSAE